MATVSASIPNLINGVSQQPFALRLASQCEEQINGYNSIVDGLTKRPNTEHVAKLLDGDYSSAYVHIINRDLNERYVVTVTDGNLTVHDFTGDEKTVTFEDPEDADYLVTGTPAQDISMVTIADNTFVVNKSIVTALDDSSVFEERDPEALVWVRQGNYATDYTIKLSSQEITYRTPESDINKVKTDYIAEQLADQVNNGIRASGSLEFAQNPLDRETITLNGTVWTLRANPYTTLSFSGNPVGGDYINFGGTLIYFRTLADAANEVTIGASIDATINNLVTKLNTYNEINITRIQAVGDTATDTIAIIYKATAGGETYTITSGSSVVAVTSPTLKHTNTAFDIEVGTTLTNTINNAVTALNNASDAETAKCSYTKNDNKIEIIFETGGTSGNSFTLAESSTVITVSAGTLTGGSAVDYTATTMGSTLHIVKDDGGDFTIEGIDSFGDQSLIVIKGKTQDFDDLPPKAVHGFQVEITGSATTAFDNYYVEFDTSSGNAKGVWLETPQPGRKVSINPETMFHSLVRNPDGTFTFKKVPFNDLVCGDEETSPYPSFLGYTINDIFFYRNRLGLLSDENVILSRAGDFFNFFRQTVTSVLDDDPIDTASLDVKVSILKYALSFNESLLLFSDQTQFMMNATDILTPRSVRIDQTTRFQADLTARPVGAGKYVYFCTNKGGYTGIREYFVDGDTRTNDATDITDHVPRYIEGVTYKLSVATNENIIVGLASGAGNDVNVYQFYNDASGNKVQSAWSKWSFPETDQVLNCEFIETTLWLVTQRPDGLFLDKMEIASSQKDTGLDYKILLDRRVHGSELSCTFSSGNTTIELPFDDEEDLRIVATSENETYPAGYLIPHTVIDENTLSVSGDQSAGAFFVGRSYNFMYHFSPLIIRDEAVGGGLVANTESRVQISKVIMNYADSGYFRVTVTPYLRESYVTTFSGQVLGSGDTLIGSHSVHTGRFEFSVRCRNMDATITIENDTHFPCRFLNADWVGSYVSQYYRLS